MNRYSSGGPSKASANTLCQKCLKRGHYSYECTAPRQERPYVSRPSRTQQLLNPKLALKLTSTTPGSEQFNKKQEPDVVGEGSADSNRKSTALSVDTRRRQRSLSSSSFDSVSTISTNRSRSRSPPRTHNISRANRRSRKQSSHDRAGGRSPSGSPEVRSRRIPDGERGRHRRSSPSSRSRSRTAISRGGTSRKSNSHNRYRNRSPLRSKDRPWSGEDKQSPTLRDRSLSPYSRRVALSRMTNEP